MEKKIIWNEEVVDSVVQKYIELNSLTSKAKIESIEITDKFVRINRFAINCEEDFSIDSLSCLEKYIDLEELHISNQPIKTLDGIEKLSKLSTICLNNNMITDISAIKDLKNITQLKLSKNIISDISALTKLKDLCLLDISYNDIEDISSLNGKSEMLYLYMNNNRISDFSPVLDMVELVEIAIAGNVSEEICSNESIGCESIDIMMNNLNPLRWCVFDREERNNIADYFRERITLLNPLYGLDMVPIAYYVDRARKEDEEYVLAVVPKDRVVIINKKRGIAVDGADVCYPSYKMFLNCEDALDYLVEETYCI